MKNIITSLLFLLCVKVGLCQEEGCKLLLQNGLYKYYVHHSTGNYMQDLKTYFASDEFKSDYKNNKWGGSIGVVVDGAPISLGANSDDSQLSTFQSSVRSATNFSTSSSFDEIASAAIPDVELAKVYKECLAEVNLNGFKIYPVVSGNSVTFMISYKKDVSTDPMPKVTFFQIKNGQNVQNQLSPGELVRDNMTVTCVRNQEDDLTLILETDRKTATLVVPAVPVGFNKDFPVGTIIASYLNYDQFNGVTKNNDSSPTGAWSSQFSKYAPCDGRQVPNSAFVRAANVINVPDLRGVFLRGLNQFDLNETSTVDPSRKNPEGKKVGDIQLDLIKRHTHGFSHVIQVAPNEPHGVSGGFKHSPGGSEGYNNYGAVDGNPDGGDETRPKNVSIFYYVRIN